MLGELGQQALTQSLPLLGMTLILYLIPTLVAWYRSHHNTAAIGAVNLFLGWTVLGWIGALIWALTRPPRATA